MVRGRSMSPLPSRVKAMGSDAAVELGGYRHRSSVSQRAPSRQCRRPGMKSFRYDMMHTVKFRRGGLPYPEKSKSASS